MFSEHEAKAFQHPRLAEFHKFVSEYHIWFDVGGQRFRVTFRIYETSGGAFCYVQSHYLRTPLEDGTPASKGGCHEHEHSALTAAVESITSHYDRAVEHGHEPSLDWFEENKLF